MQLFQIDLCRFDLNRFESSDFDLNKHTSRFESIQIVTALVVRWGKDVPDNCYRPSNQWVQ